MSMRDFSDRSALLDHAATATVLTATSRLARALHSEYAAGKKEEGLTAWETPDILQLNAWLQRCVLEASVVNDGGTGVLEEMHEQALWEEALRSETGDETAVSVHALARLMMHAHTVEQQWCIGLDEQHAETEDAGLYLRIRQRFLENMQAKRQLPSAMLWSSCEAVIRNGETPLPATVILAGFERSLPSALGRILAALEYRGVEVLSWHDYTQPQESIGLHYPSREAEMYAAAAWARELLLQGEASIAVVFPRLQDDRARIERIFSEVLLPSSILEGSEERHGIFELSLGQRLSETPIVNAALCILDILREETTVDTISRVLRSVFVPASQRFAHARACIDAELRRGGISTAPRAFFREQLLIRFNDMKDDPLRGFFGTLRPPTEKRLPSAWADYFDETLRLAGWPGDITLTSSEYQTRLRFQETLAALAGFDTLLGDMSVGQALTRLHALAASVVFQPRSVNAAVQIMGVFEAIGQRFACMRVCDMTEESWPPSAHPAACLPLALQRQAGVSDALAERHAEDMARVTTALFSSSERVVVSRAVADADRELLPSPLAGVQDFIADSDCFATVLASRLREHADIRTEEYVDERAPAVAEGSDVGGGASVLTLQSACPFRAWAMNRLDARALELPQYGVRAIDRGILLHDCLFRIWGEIDSHAALLAADTSTLVERALEATLRSAAFMHSGRLPDVMIQAEIECLRHILLEFLDLEKGRTEFRLEAVEGKVTAEIAGLRLSLRADRIDRLADGSLAVIDYKSSKKGYQDWLGERPLEPQLPLYAVSMSEEVSALAFATLRRGECRYAGLAAGTEVFPGLSDLATVSEKQDVPVHWDALMAAWRETLERLALEYRLGDARVNPRDGMKTCEYCGLQPLCRIDEYRMQNSDNMDEEQQPRVDDD
jgi:ATP-dependent helicase/nuclease subunit B